MKKILIPLLFMLVITGQALAQFDDFEIDIDNGNTYTTKRNVSLNLNSKYKFQMMVSNRSDFFGAEWIAYKTTFPSWDLTSPEGKLLVYAKFKDKEGNVSKSVSDDIVLDLTPPQNTKVEIDIPGKVTNDPELNVMLKLHAKDAFHVKISNNSSFYNTKWEKYDSKYATHGKEWQLELGDDGLKNVYVKFKDLAQNETGIVKDKILLDTEAPFNCTAMLDEGAAYTINQDQLVELKLTSNGADSMKVSESKDLDGAKWVPYKDLSNIKISDGDGEKFVFVKFKDKSGNESEVVKDGIYMDITPPDKCAILINDGAEETDDINKKVKISFTYEEDVSQMILSNTPSFASGQWRNVVSGIPSWQLDGEADGKRTVYVKFKDKSGNISAVFRDIIILKRGI